MVEIASEDEVLVPEKPLGWKPAVEYFSGEYQCFVGEQPVDGGKIVLSFALPQGPRVMSIQDFEANRENLHHMIWYEMQNPNSAHRVSVQ